MEELAEKIDEYENQITDLKSAIELKDSQITGLQLEVNELDSHLNSLTNELESRNEYITKLTDKLQNELHEKEIEWEAQKHRLIEKHEKEIMYLKNSQLDADDKKVVLLKEFEELKVCKEQLETELDHLKKSELIRYDKSINISGFKC